MATMADVAKAAGVSMTTVSHVLNNTRYVSPETQELVRQAVIRTRYRHNLAARAVATQSTQTIGLAIAAITNPGFAELVRDIEGELRANSYSLLLTDTADDPEVELQVIGDLLDRRVSGLIINPLEGSPKLTTALQDLIEEQQTPVVFLDRRSPLAADQVFSESTNSVKDLTRHLAELGHRSIAYICGDWATMSARDRLDGYRTAVRELGLDDDEDLILMGESQTRTAHEAVLSFFGGTQRTTTGLVVSNNQMTLGALRGLRELNLRIPDDVAFVCYDDLDWADLASPPISATAQDHRALARHVVELILTRIRNPALPPRTVIVPTSFQHRQSCGTHTATIHH